MWPERALTRARRRGAGAAGPQSRQRRNGLPQKTSPRPSATCGGPSRFRRRRTRALEYQRWAVRSQLRGEGRRFMRSMKRPLAVPVLHLRGDADPYVLADPVHRTQRYAPHGRFVSIAGAGHFAHEEAPGRGQRPAVAVPGRRCTAPAQRDAGAGGAPRSVLPILASWRETSLAVSTKPVSASSTAAPNTTPSTWPLPVDHRTARITLPHSASDRVHLAGRRWWCGRCRGR